MSDLKKRKSDEMAVFICNVNKYSSRIIPTMCEYILLQEALMHV